MQTAVDAVRVNMTLILPEKLLPKGTYVYQYVQLRGLYTPDDPGIGLGCRVKIGDAKSAHIESFEGAGSLLAASNADKKVTQQNVDDKQEAADANFRDSIFGRDEKDYKTRNQYGMVAQSCMADLHMVKGSGDIDKVKNIWITQLGARLYKSLTDAAPIQIPEFETAITVEEFDADEMVDPDL